MSRRIRFVLSLLVVSFALSAAACADTIAPQGFCQQTSNNTCG